MLWRQCLWQALLRCRNPKHGDGESRQPHTTECALYVLTPVGPRIIDAVEPTKRLKVPCLKTVQILCCVREEKTRFDLHGDLIVGGL